MSDTIDAEVQTQAVAIRDPQQAVSLFRTDDPAEIVVRASNVATSLKAVIQKQGLISKISGKEYPRCEAWTLLGTMLGVFPVCIWSKQVEGGWEARVEARTRDGATVGAAEAQCLRGERNWKDRDDFALRSMAQTRATAKCLRMPLGFVMTLAGYEATPAEEMTHENAPQRAAAPAPQPHTPPPAATRPAPAPAQPHGTPEQRAKMIAQLKAGPGESNRAICTEYFEKIGQLLPGEELEGLPLRFVPATVKQMKDLAEKLAEFGNSGQAARAFEPGEIEEPAPKPAPKPAQEHKPVDRKDLEQITGVLKRVTVKEGTSKKGPWKLFGLNIADGWLNSFSATVGEFAQAHEGQEVTVWYKQDDKGRTAHDIEAADDLPS